MISFSYTALDASGKKTSGSIDAENRKAALLKLQSRKLKPVTVSAEGERKVSKPEKEKSAKKFFSSKKGKIKDATTLSFLKKVLQLHGSGIQLGDALKLLSQRLSDPTEKALAQELWVELSKGQSLASAAAQRPHIFSTSTAHLIEAGEATGHLVPALQNIIAHMEEKASVRKQLVTGLTYPFLICLMVFFVILFFLFFLLPRIQSMIDSLGGKMNIFTKILIQSANLSLTVGPFLIGALVIGGIALRQWHRTEKGKKTMDRWFLKIPLIGAIIYNTELYQTSNLVGTLIESGINTTEALRLTEKTINNAELRGRFALARVQINEGASFGVAFRNHEVMPPIALDILAVGENTGSIQNSLKEITQIFREELTRSLKTLTNGIASTALTLAFVLVGLTAIGMVLSIFQVSQSLSI